MFRLPRKLIYTLTILKTYEEVSKQPCAYINQLIGQEKCYGNICCNYSNMKILYIPDAMAPINAITEENKVFCLLSKMYTVCYYSFSLSYNMANFSILSSQKEIFFSFQEKGFLFPKAASHSLNNAISAQTIRGWGS